MNDPGEKPLAGSLLWARYGKGTFVYTGLAFFRQLPAGVPGALPPVRQPDGARQGTSCPCRRVEAMAADGKNDGDEPSWTHAPAVSDLGRDLRHRHRRARGRGRCSARRSPRSPLSAARLDRPLRHAERDRRLRALEDARTVQHGRLRARRLRRQLADDRPRRDGDAGAAPSPSSRRRGRPTTDGMRFLQFYFGLPLAMVVLSIAFVPRFYRLRVLTAYEYLEGRFDLKTRQLAAFLFLLQRGLSAGHHHLRAGDRAVDGARLAAEPDLRLDRRAGDPLHRHRRHARRQPDAEASDGGDAGRDGRWRSSSSSTACRPRSRSGARWPRRDAGQDERRRFLAATRQPLHVLVGDHRRLLPGDVVLRHRPVAGAALPVGAVDHREPARACCSTACSRSRCSS